MKNIIIDRRPLLLSVLICVASIFMAANVNTSTSHLVIGMVGIFVSTYNILNDKNSFLGLNFNVSIFVLVFIIIVPLYQVSAGISYWGYDEISSADAILVLTLWMVFYISILIYLPQEEKIADFNVSDKFKVACINVISAVGVVLILRNNLDLLIYREHSVGEYLNGRISQIEFLILDRLLRPLVGISAFVIWKSKNIDAKTKVISMAIFALCCFPTAIPRFMVVVLWGPFVFGLIKGTFIRFTSILFAFIIFVGLDFYRNKERVKSFDLMSGVSGFFNNGHADTFQSFVITLKINEITFGDSLLASLLFFIPRSVWAAKGVGGGGVIAEKAQLDWSNVSLNYLAEGYLNFGYFGVLLFAVSFIYLSRSLVKSNKKETVLYYIYFSLASFFLFRGDLINSITVIVPIYFIVRYIGRYLK